MSLSFADRVWLAYWSLPRGRHGRPDSFHRLEQEHHLANGTIGKVVTGHRPSVSTATLVKLSHALEVSPSWLLDGTGEAPTPTGPVPPRDHDHAAKVEESGEHSAPRAVAPEVVAQVRAAVDASLEQSDRHTTGHEVLARAMLLISAKR